MLLRLSIPNFGEAIAGLDWIELPGLERRRAEIRQFAAGANAQWQYIWHSAQERPSVAFVPRGESKKRPVAAAALVRAAITDDTYLSLIDLGERQYWLFAQERGCPVARMDFVGDALAVMPLLRDFVSTQHTPDHLPVYTDLAELLDTLPYSFAIRPFSLDILSHSIAPKDFAAASFKRHWPVSLPTIAVLAGTVAAFTVWNGYQDEIEAAKQRKEALARAQATANRARELNQSISQVLSTTTSIATAVPAYMQTISTLPLLISGWRLSEVRCEAVDCSLTYKSQPLATWRGYMLAKPAAWPAPVFGTDMQSVVQPLVISLPASSGLKRENLQAKDAVRYQLGNLAQISLPLGLQLSVPGAWSRIAGQGMPSQELTQVPEQAAIEVKGPAALLESLSQHIPAFATFTSLRFEIGEKNEFELKGVAYAHP